jgi:hypothetical protein
VLDTILTLFAIFGLAYALKESSMLAGPRNWLMLRSVFFAKMLMCWFCTSFWCGLIVFALHQWQYGTVLIWGLGGAAIGHLLAAIWMRLSWVKLD